MYCVTIYRYKGLYISARNTLIKIATYLKSAYFETQSVSVCITSAIMSKISKPLCRKEQHAVLISRVWRTSMGIYSIGGVDNLRKTCGLFKGHEHGVPFYSSTRHLWKRIRDK